MIGVIFWAPSPRAASEEQARRVREAVPAGVPLVGVFVDEDPERIDELVDVDRARPRAAARRRAARADRALRRARDPRRARRRRLRRPAGRARRSTTGRGARRATSRRCTRTGASRAAWSPTGSCCSRAGSTRTTSRRRCARCGRTASTARAASRAPPASRITSACDASSPRPRRRDEHHAGLDVQHAPDALGRFGRFGGRFVPETVMAALDELEAALATAFADPVLRGGAGRARRATTSAARRRSTSPSA